MKKNKISRIWHKFHRVRYRVAQWPLSVTSNITPHMIELTFVYKTVSSDLTFNIFVTFKSFIKQAMLVWKWYSHGPLAGQGQIFGHGLVGEGQIYLMMGRVQVYIKGSLCELVLKPGRICHFFGKWKISKFDAFAL